MFWDVNETHPDHWCGNNTNGDKMLEIKDLCKSYRQQKILDKLNLSLPDTGLIMILGESGSGKTTLFNMLGLLDRPDSGTVLFNYQDLNKYNEKQRASYRKYNCAIIYQKYHLIDYFTVAENIALPTEIQGKTFNNREYLHMLNLENKLHRYPHQLSGGEQQRVALARALSANASIILADEPTGALDSYNANIIMGILKRESEQKLVLVVTHNTDLAQQYGDAIVVLKDGSIPQKLPYILKRKSPHFAGLKKEPSIKIKHLFEWTKRAIFHKKGKYLASLFCYTFCLLGVLTVMGLKQGLSSYCDELITRRIDHNYIDVFTIEEGYLAKVDRRISEITDSYAGKLDVTYSYDKLLSQLTVLGLGSDEYYEIKVVDNIEQACINELFYEKFKYHPDMVRLDGKLEVPYLHENSYESISMQISFPFAGVYYEGVTYNVAKLYLPRSLVEEQLDKYPLPLIGEKIGEQISVFSYLSKYHNTYLYLPYEIILKETGIKEKLYQELINLEGVYPQYSGEDTGENYVIIATGDEMLRNTFKDLLSSGELVLLLFLMTLIMSVVSLITLLLSYSFKEREKEFGIIRTYGGTNQDVAKLIALEGLLFNAAAYFSAIILALLLKAAAYNLSSSILKSQYKIDILHLKCSHCLGTFLISAFVFVLAIASPIIQSSKFDITGVIHDD